MAFQNAATRKTMYNACMIEQSTQEYIDTQLANELAAQQALDDAFRQTMEDEFDTHILNWCNAGAGNGNVEADTDHISFRILDRVSSDWANTQESSLTTAGYIVERNSLDFKISLPE
jgi:hypothetical protein